MKKLTNKNFNKKSTFWKLWTHCNTINKFHISARQTTWGTNKKPFSRPSLYTKFVICLYALLNVRNNLFELVTYKWNRPRNLQPQQLSQARTILLTRFNMGKTIFSRFMNFSWWMISTELRIVSRHVVLKRLHSFLL